MSIFEKYSTNVEEEASGKWFDLHVNKDNSVCRLKIARNDFKYNPKFTEATLKYYDELEAEHGKGVKKSHPAAIECERKIIAETVLVGWENVQDMKGDDIPYSFEKALELLRALPHLVDDIKALAENYENYKAEKMEENAGN